MSQQTDEQTTPEFWWGNSPTAPPLPEIPVARFKVGDVVPNSWLTPHVVLGMRLSLSPHPDYESGWDGSPVWEYSLWKWTYSQRCNSYSYDEWGWVKEPAILKVWDQFQEKQEKVQT
jgi:hypothetical protein